MTKVVFLCLVVFLKLVLLAELPVVREIKSNKISKRRAEKFIMVKREKLTKAYECLKETIKLMEDDVAVRTKRRRDLEGFIVRLGEIKKQKGENDSSIETALVDLLQEADKSKNMYEREISEIKKRISKYKKTEESEQITEDTDIESLEE